MQGQFQDPLLNNFPPLYYARQISRVRFFPQLEKKSRTCRVTQTSFAPQNLCCSAREEEGGGGEKSSRNLLTRMSN